MFRRVISTLVSIPLWNQASKLWNGPVFTNRRYQVGYDTERRIPKYVFETLTRDDIEGPYSGRAKWRADLRIKPLHRVNVHDYRVISEEYGLEKGHMAAAGNYKGDPEARQETFILSNCAPQFRDFNRGSWNQIEKEARKMVDTADRVHIITGPLFLPVQDRGGNWWVRYPVVGADPSQKPIAVPSHFYKIAIAQYGDAERINSWIAPNKPGPQKCPKEYEEGIENVLALIGLELPLY